MPRQTLLIVRTLLVLLAVAAPARSAGLVADLSHHLVQITTAFAGSDVLLFGTVGDSGRDVIVTVRGPLSEAIVRQKTRVGFIWINTRSVTFRDVPEFYAVAANAPLADIANPAEFARHEIGRRYLRLQPDPDSLRDYSPEEIDVFREGLIRRKEAGGLYKPSIGVVTFVGGPLFRTTLSLPANVPPGNYQVQVFELQDGTIVAAQSSALIVSKVGLEAELFDAAREDSYLYGAASLLLAVFAGWSANAAFKKS